MDVINTPPAAPRWQNFSREHRASRHGDARRPALPRFRFGPVGANRRLERSAVHIAAQHVRVAPERLRASPLRSREDLQPARGQVALGARRARLLGTALARRYARFDHGILSPLRGLLHSRCRRISPGRCRHPPSPGRSWTHASSLHVPAQVPLYVALASHLGVQQWHWHLCQEGVRKSALGMEVLASATVCSATPEAAVTVQYVANEYSIINASLTGGAGQIACDAQCDGLRCKRQLPFLAYARRSRFVILTTPPPAEARGYGGSVAEEVRNTLETLATLRPRPRVLVRSPIQSFPPGLCKRMVDPLAKPFEYNLTDPSHQRAILRFKMQLGKQGNEEARAAVDAYAAAHGKHVAYMDMFRATSLRPGGRHSARKDCTHWCLPGPIDDWVRLALAWWLLRGGTCRARAAAPCETHSARARPRARDGGDTAREQATALESRQYLTAYRFRYRT